MTERDETRVDDRRRNERQEFGGRVTIRFIDEQVVGPGQNISSEGVFFVADGAVRVAVDIEGQDEPIYGELVRVQSMGEQRTGVAVRFTD